MVKNFDGIDKDHKGFVSVADIRGFPIEPDQVLYAVHSADGARLGVMTDRQTAIASAYQREVSFQSAILHGRDVQALIAAIGYQPRRNARVRSQQRQRRHRSEELRIRCGAEELALVQAVKRGTVQRRHRDSPVRARHGGVPQQRGDLCAERRRSSLGKRRMRRGCLLLRLGNGERRQQRGDRQNTF